MHWYWFHFKYRCLLGLFSVKRKSTRTVSIWTPTFLKELCTTLQLLCVLKGVHVHFRKQHCSKNLQHRPPTRRSKNVLVGDFMIPIFLMCESNWWARNARILEEIHWVPTSASRLAIANRCYIVSIQGILLSAIRLVHLLNFVGDQEKLGVPLRQWHSVLASLLSDASDFSSCVICRQIYSFFSSEVGIPPVMFAYFLLRPALRHQTRTLGHSQQRGY